MLQGSAAPALGAPGPFIIARSVPAGTAAARDPAPATPLRRAVEALSPPTRYWPTPAQVAGWPVIAGGAHVLITAPTGSGKTLTAFLWAVDRLMSGDPAAEAGTRVLYVSPLKALAYDIERNLGAPLAGIVHAARALGAPVRAPRVAVRTGETPARERQR